MTRVSTREVHAVFNGVARNLQSAMGEDGTCSRSELRARANAIGGDGARIADAFCGFIDSAAASSNATISTRDLDRALETAKAQLVDAYDLDNNGLSPDEISHMSATGKLAVAMARDLRGSVTSGSSAAGSSRSSDVELPALTWSTIGYRGAQVTSSGDGSQFTLRSHPGTEGLSSGVLLFRPAGEVGPAIAGTSEMNAARAAADLAAKLEAHFRAAGQAISVSVHAESDQLAHFRLQAGQAVPGSPDQEPALDHPIAHTPAAPDPQEHDTVPEEPAHGPSVAVPPEGETPPDLVAANPPDVTVGVASVSSPIGANAAPGDVPGCKLKLTNQTDTPLPRLSTLPAMIRELNDFHVKPWLGLDLLAVGPHDLLFEVTALNRNIEVWGNARLTVGDGIIQVAVGKATSEQEILGICLHEYGHSVFEYVVNAELGPDALGQRMVSSFNEFFADILAVAALGDLSVHARTAGPTRDFAIPCTVEQVGNGPHDYLAPCHDVIARHVREGRALQLLGEYCRIFLEEIRHFSQGSPASCAEVNAHLRSRLEAL